MHLSVGFNTQQLLVFSLWKNRNRRYQRPLGLVPTIGVKEQKQFQISDSLLADKGAVDNAEGGSYQGVIPANLCSAGIAVLRPSARG